MASVHSRMDSVPNNALLLVCRKSIVTLVDLGTERTAPTGLGLSTRSGRLCLAALQSVQWPVREQCGGEVHSSGAPLLTKGSSNYYKNAQNGRGMSWRRFPPFRIIEAF